MATGRPGRPPTIGVPWGREADEATTAVHCQSQSERKAHDDIASPKPKAYHFQLVPAVHSSIRLDSITLVGLPSMRPLQYVAAAALLATVSAAGSPTVSVKNGSYYGLYQDTYDQDLFLGIPYAQPPVGDLRFRNPEPLNTTWSDAKNATEYSPECYGYGSDQWVLGNVISEDCLTINVVRPSGVVEGDNLPVGFWIHGGAYLQGGSRDPRYNFSYILQEAVEAGKPFIGVSINYRLHGFGFLWGSTVEEAGVGNLGLKDQRLALHWVNENIAAFGGDPDKVTIWGESAGAGSVGHQLVAFGGRDDGLFRGGIMQSGAPINGPSKYTNASAFDVYYNNITAATNCSTAEDTLDCLRQIPVTQLSDILNSSVVSSAPFYPVVDGELIEKAGPTLMNEGKFLHVPILQGTNHDEGTAFGTTGIDTTEEFVAYVESVTESAEDAAVLADLYPDIPEIGIPGTLHGRPGNDTPFGNMYKRASAYAGDKTMHAPRRFTSQIWAANNVSSYSYVFNVLVNGLSPYIGSTHFQEVALVFYNLKGDGYNNLVSADPFLNEPETFAQLARTMSSMWTSFIVDQTPNSNNATEIKWPEYTLEAPQNIVFDVNASNLAYVEPDIYRAEGIAYITNGYTKLDYR